MERTVIEFSGLPGSGKSTIVKTLISEYLYDDNWFSEEQFSSKFQTTSGRIYTIWIAVISKAIDLKSNCFLILKHVPFDKKFLAIKRIVKILRYNELIKKQNTKLICSEGFFQAVLELLDIVEEGKLTSAIEDICKVISTFFRINKFCFVIFCDISPKIANYRIASRTETFNSIDAMDENTRNIFLLKRYNRLQLLLEKMDRQILKNNVFVINTEDDLKILCFRINEKINSWMI